MAVEILAGTVVTHSRARVGVPGGDLHIAQVNAGVKHGGHEGVPEHVWVHPRETDASAGRELAQSPGRRVPVHPDATAVEKQRSDSTIACGRLNSAADRRRQRHKDHFVALPVYPQNPMPVLLAEVVDIRANGFEDSQAEQAQQADEGEVEGVGRLPCGGEHGFKLEVGEPERGRLRWDPRTPYVVGGRVLKDAIDYTGSVEARDDRQPSRNRRWLEPTHVLQPAQVQLQIVTLGGQWGELAVTAPLEEPRRSDSVCWRDVPRYRDR